MAECTYIIGDTRDVTAKMADGSVDLIVTSPPFLALRSYLPDGHPDKHREIGSEAGPADFLATLLDLTVEWRRVLAPHGSLCVELGDTFSGTNAESGWRRLGERAEQDGPPNYRKTGTVSTSGSPREPGQWPLPKSMCGIPTLYTWSLAYGRNLLRPEQTFAPWRIRNLIVWARANPPVGALGDKFRPATSYITVACTSATRWFDLDAVRTEHKADPENYTGNGYTKGKPQGDGDPVMKGNPAGAPPLDWHNDNNTGPNGGDILWQLNTQPYAGSHYATYPSELPARLIQAMCPQQVCTTCGEPRRRIVEQTGEYALHRAEARGKDGKANRMVAGLSRKVGRDEATKSRVNAEYSTLGWTDCGHGGTWRNGHVFDPFGGSGTTGLAATGAGRDATLIDIDARNAELARERIGMFLNVKDAP